MANLNECVNGNWTADDGAHDGGVSYGHGFCISWQRGPLNEAGRNGAFLIEVLEACLSQVVYFQSSKYACDENALAIEKLDEAIDALRSRRSRRASDGTLGTSKV